MRVKVMSHEPWGVMVRIIGHERIGASVDGVVIDSPHPRAGPEDYPAIGVERSAVAIRIREDGEPPWVYLSMLHTDVFHLSRRAER
ncbi:hypothetical protein [Nocardiopsis alba]|uniref:Uncharacterized protein n=1 Tax=Nocardiopsis alba (strain ATCC BAA-2165 / BE74) TaxID=1205910 RepID=J7LI81_NOCAA|nr:hypothetical protein [Nocardiopsis alba]AFR10377.1 hypothetical protein B005_2294 [Nocardiopsis alba ATCC BAA-2165]